VLTRKGRMDDVTIHVEARLNQYRPEGMDDEAQLVIARIKDTIGLSTRVVIEAPGAIERSLGKAKRVIDKRLA
jgi:phenylacetate-CoA ligase